MLSTHQTHGFGVQPFTTLNLKPRNSLQRAQSPFYPFPTASAFTPRHHCRRQKVQRRPCTSRGTGRGAGWHHGAEAPRWPRCLQPGTAPRNSSDSQPLLQSKPWHIGRSRCQVLWPCPLRSIQLQTRLTGALRGDRLRRLYTANICRYT